MPERDGQQRLGVDPTVRDHTDEVLRRQRLSDGHSEVQRVFLLGTPLLQHKHLLMQNLLTVDVLDKDPEGLGASMHLRIPLEIGRYRELHHEAGARDGLHVGTEIELGKLVNQLVDGLPHLREADELADLGAGKVVVALPGEVLLLHLPEDLFGETLEVPQRRLRSPHPLVDHLAPVQGPQGQRGPATTKADLEDGTHDPTCGLLHVDHIRKQGETVELQLGDVRLQEHVHLGGGLVCTSLDGHGHALHELCQLHLLLLAHGDVLELVREREKTEQLDV
mmetsp:Transcript_29704/g.63181  ORF Transcript_29704/g.63181 Transcript_29704/m.63181 type:complete len:279 (-) Transcript_29704:1719-2555(-)